MSDRSSLDKVDRLKELVAEYEKLIPKASYSYKRFLLYCVREFFTGKTLRLKRLRDVSCPA